MLYKYCSLITKPYLCFPGKQKSGIDRFWHGTKSSVQLRRSCYTPSGSDHKSQILASNPSTQGELPPSRISASERCGSAPPAASRLRTARPWTREQGRAGQGPNVIPDSLAGQRGAGCARCPTGRARQGGPRCAGCRPLPRGGRAREAPLPGGTPVPPSPASFAWLLLRPCLAPAALTPAGWRAEPPAAGSALPSFPSPPRLARSPASSSLSLDV